MWQQLLADLEKKEAKALARSISFIENEQPGYEEMLASIHVQHTIPIIGITGAPGAGKSTLTDALIGKWVQENKRVAVLCIDPSSPFNMGALLGDRIRMSNWYLHENVFIRSLATRGSLGGLHPKTIEVTELLKAAQFDIILIETVGVGQSEVEIAGLADITIVVLVPEGGDEVQTMKAGLMEIADIFVVNKSDRPDADLFLKNLRQMLAPVFKNHHEVPVIKTIGTTGEGIEELYQKIIQLESEHIKNEKKSWLLAEKAFHLIQHQRMKNYSKEELMKQIESAQKKDRSFNLYQFVKSIS
jgi:LAO/AO transport system kinase